MSLHLPIHPQSGWNNERKNTAQRTARLVGFAVAVVLLWVALAVSIQPMPERASLKPRLMFITGTECNPFGSLADCVTYATPPPPA